MGRYLDIAKDALRQVGVDEKQTATFPPLASIERALFDDLDVPEAKPPFHIPAQLITSADELNNWVRRHLRDAPDLLTVDIETTGLNFAKDRICGIAINAVGENVYIAFGHDNEQGLDLATTAATLNPLLSSSIPKLCHHATFDIPFLLIQRFDIAPPYYDTRLIGREIHARELRSYGLKELACDHIHPNSDFWDEHLRTKLKSRFRSARKDNLWRLSSSEVFAYACADVYLTRRLFDVFRKKVNEAALCKPYLTLERQVVEVMASISRFGFAVDESKLISSLASRMAMLIDLDRKLDEHFGQPSVSYTSPKQVLNLVKGRGHAPVHPKTGKDSVCVDALVALKTDDDAVVTLIQRKRVENQVKQLSGFPSHVVDGRIHPHLTISAQLGERFSCTDPSLYTGKKHADANEVTLRHFVTPDDGCLLAFFDFSASHFRILAHLCGDEPMINIFKSGRDFHRSVASMMFGIPYSDVSKEERDRAKPIGFSVIYGMGSRSLAEGLRVNVTEAARMKAKFLNEVFPKLGQYLQMTCRATESRGYVLSGIYGVRISVPKDQAYKGVNYQIQATEAEILKRSLVRLHQFLSLRKSRVALPMHDEIIVQVNLEEMQLIPEIKAMIEDHGLRAPIACDVAIARTRWAEKEAFTMEMAES